MESKTPSYKDVTHLFVKLRGQGLALSAADLAYVEMWARLEIEPEIVGKVMHMVAEKKRVRNKNFPQSLQSIDRELRKFLEMQRESIHERE